MLTTKDVEGTVLQAEGDCVTAMISTEAVDRDGEVLLAAGCQKERYERNPVVLFAHQHSMPPIGRGEDLVILPGQGVQATTRFAGSMMAREIADLYRGRFLNAWSVGFMPHATEAASREGQTGQTITEWELWEYSAVPVPANPEALCRAATEQQSDLAAQLLRLYYPDAKDANEVARVASDVRRVAGAAESLRNIRRHSLKTGEPLPWQPDAVRPAFEALAEILGEPLDPAKPEPDPTDGALSADAVRALTATVAELTGLVSGYPARLRSMVAEGVTAARRAHIGGRL